MKTTEKNLDYYRKNAEEDYLTTPISVLRYISEMEAALRQPPVSSICSCGIPYVETKKSDIPYDTDDNVYYTDILIHHCPKCGNIDGIDEY